MPCEAGVSVAGCRGPRASPWSQATIGPDGIVSVGEVVSCPIDLRSACCSAHASAVHANGVCPSWWEGLELLHSGRGQSLEGHFDGNGIFDNRPNLPRSPATRRDRVNAQVGDDPGPLAVTSEPTPRHPAFTTQRTGYLLTESRERLSWKTKAGLGRVPYLRHWQSEGSCSSTSAGASRLDCPATAWYVASIGQVLGCGKRPRPRCVDPAS